MNCAAMKRVLEKSCAPRFADIGELPGLVGVEEDHGLGAPAAVLVAPKDRMSMPARQVMSAGERLVAAARWRSAPHP